MDIIWGVQYSKKIKKRLKTTKGLLFKRRFNQKKKKNHAVQYSPPNISARILYASVFVRKCVCIALF